MPRKKKESNLKKAYLLWWNYLRLSGNYKNFCEWMDRRAKDPDLQIPKKSNWFELWAGYNFFGNVHVDSFEEWWKDNKSKLMSRKEGGFPKPVEDYTDFVMLDMEDVIEEFKRENKREPSLEEFKRHFLEKLKFAGPRFFFMVTFFEGDRIEDLKKEFIKILREKKKQQLESVKKRAEEYRRLLEKKFIFPSYEAKTEEYLTWAGGWEYLTSPLRLEEVERYLKVYSLFAQGQKWKPILEEIDPRYKGDLADLKRSIYKDRENAKRIIRNAEKGSFPGRY